MTERERIDRAIEDGELDQEEGLVMLEKLDYEDREFGRLVMSDAQERAWERRQLGLCNF